MTLVYDDLQYEHIEFDENDVPYISGTTMKVVELVLGKICYGWSPEELHFQYPHVSMGKIHSALAYYWDHQQEIDKDIQFRLNRVNQIKNEINSKPILNRLGFI